MRSFVPFTDGYELIDAGGNLKLERWGEIITIRPEHQAYFQPGKKISEWRQLAHWEFMPVSAGSLNGSWKKLRSDAPEEWHFATCSSTVKLTAIGNKHIGIFPEQLFNWLEIQQAPIPGKFLNLFAYTGMSSVVGCAHGLDVTHVDSIRGMIDAARINMELSGLEGIRWAVEDAFRFVQRELKRGNRYDIIQLDPPAWGLGKKGEKWKLELLLPQLLNDCFALLNPGGKMLVSTYSPKLELSDLQNHISGLDGVAGKLVTEIWMKSTSGKDLFFGLVAQVDKR